MYVWRSKGEASKPKSSVSAVKHGSGSIMLWGCFAVGGTGTLHKLDGIIKDYFQTLQLHLRSTARWLKLGQCWVFQQNNDPKHILKLEWIKQPNVKLLE